MAVYRSMFLDESAGNLVSVGLDLTDMIVEVEEESGDTTDQSIEIDIKRGYVYNQGYDSDAMTGAPLIYELSIGTNRTPENLASHIVTDPEMNGGYRGVRGAFNVLFNNYILTRPIDRGRSTSGRTRFWYEVMGGTITTYQRCSKGVKLGHFLLGRDGTRKESISGYGLLPNIYSGGESCHWGLSEVSRWGQSAGKGEGDPDTLAKSYDLFKAGVGNNDLASSNTTEPIQNREMKDILEEFKESYVVNIEHELSRTRMLTYVNGMIEGLYGDGLSSEGRYNINQLASILGHTPNFYIEDYL